MSGTSSNGAIRRVNFVDVRQSMANGGGPACLRLRVACDPANVDPRFLVDEGKLDRLAEVIGAEWPEEITPAELQSQVLIADVERARSRLLGIWILRGACSKRPLAEPGRVHAQVGQNGKAPSTSARTCVTVQVNGRLTRP